MSTSRQRRHAALVVRAHALRRSPLPKLPTWKVNQIDVLFEILAEQVW